MLQNVHDELATTKRELKNKKRVMTDMELESKDRTISELETEILRLTILFANVRSSQTTEK
jgi:hypothetical protein